MKKQTVFINKHLTGILSLPDSVELENGDFPTVIFFHGFASDKDEVNGFYRDLSEEFISEHIITLRIDFRGFGESKFPTNQATLNTMIQDGLETVRYIKSLKYSSARINIVGFSLGAAVAMAITTQEDIQSVMLISPTLKLQSDFQKFLGTDNYHILSQCKTCTTLDLTWRQIEVGKGFYDSILEFDPSVFLTKFEGFLYIITGSNDFSCDNAKQIFIDAITKNKELKVLDNLDHIFNDDIGQSSLKTISSLTVAWFVSVLSIRRPSLKF